MDDILKVVNAIQASYIHYKSNEECEISLDEKAPYRLVFVFRNSDSVKMAQERYESMVVNRLPLDVNKEDFGEVVNKHYDKVRDYVTQNRDIISSKRP